MSARRVLQRLSRLAPALVGASLLGAIGADRVDAHALGQVFTLPVPLTLYLAAAAAAVAASFVVAVVLVRPAGSVPSYGTRPIGVDTARALSVALQVLGLLWWFGAIVAGLLVDSISPLPAILVWILLWVGLPIVTVVFGNPWPSLSPFRTLFGLLERGARLAGFNRLDVGLRYPAALARWPAVALLFGAVWSELILPDRITPGVIAALLSWYTVLTMAGMTLFGRAGWLRNVELFEVYLGWFGRVGPVGRRVVAPEICQGCGEACTPERCVDCPECAVVAESGERRAELRPWFTGLTEVIRGGWSDAAFIVLALAAVSYDGLSETSVWGSVMNPLFDALFPIVGGLNTVLVAQTLGLLLLWLIFLAAFTVGAALTRAMHDADHPAAPVGATAATYAATLLPIAGGYLIAHYLTLIIQGVVWVPIILADPLASTAPPLDWIPISGVWYLSVGAIVAGHIAAVVLAHRLALRDSPGRPVLAGLPLVVLMIGYTVFSLWIIAQPITLEPISSAATALLR
ncbi:MAG: hypothetical protein OEW24_07345 [Chloroflexota bacterium]|nr:hypothetical protein [Chloroflexota bacterium]